MTALAFALMLAGCSTKNWTAADWYGKGTSVAGDGKYQEAVDAFTQAVEKDPDHAPAYQDRGRAHAELGNLGLALADFKRVLSLHDKRVPQREVYREMGAVYFRMGKLDDAVTAWQKGLGMVKDDPDLLNSLAAAYLRLGRVDKASEAALAAYAVDPSLPEVLNTMGEVAMAKKEYRQAADLFEQAIERRRVKPLVYWNAAVACELTRQYDKAKQYAKQYIEAEQDIAARQKAYQLIERARAAEQKTGAGS